MPRESASGRPPFFLKVQLQRLIVRPIDCADFPTHVQIRLADDQVHDVDVWLRDDDVITVLVKLDMVITLQIELQTAVGDDELLIKVINTRGGVILTFDMVSCDRRVVAHLLGEGSEVICNEFKCLTDNRIERFLHSLNLRTEA